MSNRIQLKESVAASVLSGGRRTKAENIRATSNLLIDSVLNFDDDADVAGGYLAISPDGLVDVSFIKGATPSGLFLRDDGTWAAAGGGGGSQDLESVLTVGRTTGELPIVSDNGKSSLYVVDATAKLAFAYLDVDNSIYVDYATTAMLFDDGTDNGSIYIESPGLSIGHTTSVLIGVNAAGASGYSNYTPLTARMTYYNASNNGSIRIEEDFNQIDHTLEVIIDSPLVTITQGVLKTQIIQNVSGTDAIDTGGILFDSSSQQSVDWNNRYLYDSSVSATLDWDLRYLYSNWTATGNLKFVSGIGIDTTLTAGTDVLNIGATNANVINYGNSSTIHNFLGTAVYELQVNSYVTDKLMTLNYGGAAASGIGVGFEVEENSVITGYLKTNAARSGFSLLTPAIAFRSDLSLSLLTGNRTHSLPDATGTLALAATTLAGYGIVDAQPLDSDLTTIAGLTATSDNFMQAKAGAWASRTIAQVKTDLSIYEEKNQLTFQNSSIGTYASNTTYFMGEGFLTMVTSTNTQRRGAAPLTGHIYKVKFQGWCTVIDTGTPANCTLKINNKTAGTSVTVSTTINYDAVFKHYVFTLVTPFAVTENDELEAEIDTATFNTLPTTVFHIIQAFFRRL